MRGFDKFLCKAHSMNTFKTSVMNNYQKCGIVQFNCLIICIQNCTKWQQSGASMRPIFQLGQI